MSPRVSSSSPSPPNSRRGHPQRLTKVRQARPRHRVQAAVRRRGPAACLVLLALAAPAFAWGPEGHRVVGDIAARYLNPKARAQIAELLKGDRLADGQPRAGATLGEGRELGGRDQGFSTGAAAVAPGTTTTSRCAAARNTRGTAAADAAPRRSSRARWKCSVIRTRGCGRGTRRSNGWHLTATLHQPLQRPPI